MKMTITETDFIQAFHACDRYSQFGYDALVSLFAYLEALEGEIGVDLDLDVIGLCCDYSVSDVDTIAQAYGINVDGLDDDEKRDAVLDYLTDHTSVIDADCDGRILYCSAF